MLQGNGFAFWNFIRLCKFPQSPNNWKQSGDITPRDSGSQLLLSFFPLGGCRNPTELHQDLWVRDFQCLSVSFFLLFNSPLQVHAVLNFIQFSCALFLLLLLHSFTKLFVCLKWQTRKFYSNPLLKCDQYNQNLIAQLPNLGYMQIDQLPNNQKQVFLVIVLLLHK